MKQALVAIIFVLMLALPVAGSSPTANSSDVTEIAYLNHTSGSSSIVGASETIQLEIAETLKARQAKVQAEAGGIYQGAGYLQPSVEVFGSSTAPDASIATLDPFSAATNGIPTPSTAIVMMLGLGGFGLIGFTRRAHHHTASR